MASLSRWLQRTFQPRLSRKAGQTIAEADHAPQASLLDLLQIIYKEYSAAIKQRKGLLYGSEPWVNNSNFISPIASRLSGEMNQCDASWATSLPQLIETRNFGPYHASFASALLAAGAEHLLQAGSLMEATRLAETAFNRNRFDVWVQRVLLNCRAHLNGDLASIEDTEAWLKTRFCGNPFEKLETTTESQIAVCCPSWLPVVVGSFEEGDVANFSNSEPMNQIRESILDGSFRHCSRIHCPKITQRELPARDDVNIGTYQARTFPRDVVFSHDPSCNLSCPSCRKTLAIVPKSEQDRFDSVSGSLLPLMLNADTVHICGSGDPIASTHFRSLLKSYSIDPRAHRNILLQTNGVLCDQRAWDDLGLAGLVKTVMVSLDAAREETYNYTRRGGDWRRVLKNVQFLCGLKSSGSIDQLYLLFVVQGMNYREMTEFVEMGKLYKADKVIFQAISNWGTYTEAEFAKHNIFSFEHAEHSDFVRMLNNEVFDDPIVDLHGIGIYRRTTGLEEARAVPA